MTLDEAVKRAEEKAEEQQLLAYNLKQCKDYGNPKSTITRGVIECETCADEHRQLAEWLKDYKRLKEQEPSEDAVSRTQAIEFVNEVIGGKNDFADAIRDGVEAVLSALPPVTPTQKWIPVSERLPKEFEFVNCTCHSLIDDREDWVIETVYVQQPPDSPYSDWGNIPMLNMGDCEVVAWMHRDIPKPYKAEMESEE